MAIIRWRPNIEDIENALTVVQRPEDVSRTEVVPVSPHIVDRVFAVRPGIAPRSRDDLSYAPTIRDQIELPRMCGSRRMPWMARYILVSGRWRFSCAVQVDNLTQHQLYDGRVHDTFEFSGANNDYETCAFCGVTGWGAIHCASCNAFICHGTLFRNGSGDWGRCVCGRDSPVERRDHVQTAIYPKSRAR